MIRRTGFTLLLLAFLGPMAFPQDEQARAVDEIYRWRDAKLGALHHDLEREMEELEGERARCIEEFEHSHRAKMEALEKKREKKFHQMEQKFEKAIHQLERQREQIENRFSKAREKFEHEMERAFQKAEEEAEKFHQALEKKFPPVIEKIHHRFHEQTEKIHQVFEEKLSHLKDQNPPGPDLGRHRKRPEPRRQHDEGARPHREEIEIIEEVERMRNELKELEAHRDMLLKVIKKLERRKAREEFPNKVTEEL
ncbi:MAG: hypothetical protein ACYTG7_05230 [Planctomycetota bacterium]